MRKLTAVLAFLTVCLSAQSAFAYYNICNRQASPVWVAFASYIPRTNTVREECYLRTVASGSACSFNAWRAQGWWRLTQNQCVTVLAGPIVNRYNFFLAEADNGRFWAGSQQFYVSNAGFLWEEFSQTQGGNPCVIGVGAVDFCTANGYWAGFRRVDTGNNTNWTTDLTL